jgi:hypothetical protein
VKRHVDMFLCCGGSLRNVTPIVTTRKERAPCSLRIVDLKREFRGSAVVCSNSHTHNAIIGLCANKCR